MKEAHKKKKSAVATDMSTICEQLYSYTFFCSSSYRTAQIFFIKNPSFCFPFGC